MPATLHWLDKRAESKRSEAGGAAATGAPTDHGGGRGRRPFRRTRSQGSASQGSASRGLPPRLSFSRGFYLALLASTLLWGLILWAVVALVR